MTTNTDSAQKMALRERMPYYMRSQVSDQRDDNKQNPHREATFHELAKVGVELVTVPQAELEKLARLYDMSHRDMVKISMTMENYDKTIKTFFEEHLHKDAELRFIVKGSGFFDVRSAEDAWIRIPVSTGDFLYLPPGIYHRFTTDRKNMVEAIRLFQSNPCWVAFPRATTGDLQPEREQFLLKNGLHPSSSRSSTGSDPGPSTSGLGSGSYGFSGYEPGETTSGISPNGTEYTCSKCQR